MNTVLDLVRRGWRKPPHVIARWLWRKIVARRAATQLPKLARRLTGDDAARRLGFAGLDQLHGAMRTTAPFSLFNSDPSTIGDALGEVARAEIMRRAEAAMNRTVDFLGSGPHQLGTPIDWATDFKSGVSWPMSPSSTLHVLDLNRPSDIKVPWELSRLQWLLPVGQAYLLTNDEKYAQFARDIVEEWFDANPICTGPNWLCAMDVALRAIAMTWLFHACKASDAWTDSEFSERLVIQLYLHSAFVDTHLEWSDVAGNHLTTDLAGLVVVGLALGGKGDAKRWVDTAWRHLEDQFPAQVPEDGVCREASVPYHRLVAELFLLPALARRAYGLPVTETYWARLRTMATFTRSYLQPGNSIPIWGDADDGRALPLGSQELNDHRYLIELLETTQAALHRPAHDETLWWLGPGDNETGPEAAPTRQAFPEAGVYILRSDEDHVFVDAGPVGMGGRGGHGHNDCLSFEAVLDGVRLIVDPGCYVYTADWQARNRFRGTASHNTPEIDGQEINRMPRDDWLWYLENDARPEILRWETSSDSDVLSASHSGYQRLSSPLAPVRTLQLSKSDHGLIVRDRFEGTGDHAIQVSLCFAPGIEISSSTPNHWTLSNGEKSFSLIGVLDDGWSSEIVEEQYSASYGIKETVVGLRFKRSGPLAPLAFGVFPSASVPEDIDAFMAAEI